ncbi:MAG: pentatricopeptide repeat protein [Crocinitomicaceae bacterium]|jgi:pentatricopeptide repeat protein
MKKLILNTALLFSSLVVVTACSEIDDSMSIDSQFIGTADEQFKVTELIPRNQDLSLDEFMKIEQKFNNLKAKYEADNTDYESLIKLAEIYIYEARVSGEHPYYYTAALKTLNEMIDIENQLTRDQHFTVLFYKSTVELSQHHFSAALKTAEKALAINSLNAGIYGVLVDAHVEIGNYDEAVKMCDQMLQIRPDLRSYSRTSYLREIFGDVKGSKKAMMDAINAGAPYSEYKCWTLTTLGNIYEAEGQLDSAQVCYEYSKQERENYPFGIAGTARVLAKKGETETAIALYEEAINILPEIGFNIELAKLKRSIGQTEEVAKMVSDIEKMFKEDIESGHNMSLEYANFLCTFKKDYETALTYGKEELKLRPSNIDVNKLLAFVYYRLGDKKKAESHVNVALSTEKKDADLWCLKGLIQSDRDLVKKSFNHNPHQSHFLAEEAKAFIQ